MNFEIKISSAGNTILNTREFGFTPGKINFLLGESGIGKTLLSKAVYGLIDPMELDVVVNGQEYEDYIASGYCRSVRKNSFYVFQEPSSHLNPLRKINTQLNEGSLGKNSGEKEILSRLWDTENYSGLKDIIDIFPKPYRPSGGEKQRILAAMALKKIDIYNNKNSKEDTLFIFDEPTGNLDNYYRDILIDQLFNRYRENKFTILFITHDYSVISNLYNNHQDLEKDAIFRELNRRNGKLTLDRFEPEDYFEWLREEEKHRSSASGETLLTVDSGLRILGRELNFTRQGRVKPLEVKKGVMTYLKAPSGVGKTTVVKTVMGVYRADKFNMIINGREISHETPESVWDKSLRGREVTMAFQHADEALNLNSTVRDVFKGLPLNNRLNDEQLLNVLRQLLDGIDKSFLDKKVWYLSGGQKQKVNLLRSLVLDTGVIILDEPTSGMDFNSIRAVMRYIEKKQDEKKAILIISHNEEIFDAIVSPENVYYLKAEKIKKN